MVNAKALTFLVRITVNKYNKLKKRHLYNAFDSFIIELINLTFYICSNE